MLTASARTPVTDFESVLTQLPVDRRLKLRTALVQVGLRQGIGLQVGDQGLVEALQLLLAQFQQPLPFLVLCGGLGAGPIKSLSR
jgi:hypothetical protein